MISTALHHHVRVPIPKKTYQRKQNSSIYIYLYTQFFRKNGKPSNHSVNIGKLDPTDSSLIPNDHYYEYFGHDLDTPAQDQFSTFCGTFSIGYSAVVSCAIHQLNLDLILKKHFPSYWKEILTIAEYAIKEGSIMTYIDDYLESHFCFASRRTLTSQRVSDLHAALSSCDRASFFKEWIAQCADDDYIVYDVTSISTYSSRIEEAEYGYNRDHDPLKQINLGLFSTTKSKLPVYYENYNGSLTDKVNLDFVLQKAQEFGMKRVGLVLDGGFFDQEQLEYMNRAELKFTVGMPSHLEISQDILNKFRDQLFQIQHLTSFDSNYAMMMDYEVFGIPGRVLIGLNTLTRDLMMTGLKNDIEKREKELKDGKIKKYETVVKKKRYTDLFKIFPREMDAGYTFELNQEALFEYSKNYGYFLIFTTDFQSSANDLLYYYRAKDVDEKMFYQLKDYMGMRRLRTQSQATTNGKIFNLFIALILRNYLYQMLNEYKTLNHLTFEKCIRKLENIQVVLRKNQKPCLTKALTRQQKELLELFGISANDLLDFVISSPASLV